MSELRNNDNLSNGTQKPKLCISCHEFFGSMDQLCSKCYRDKSKEAAEQQLSKASPIVDKAASNTRQEDAVSAIKDQKTLEEVKMNENDKTEKHQKQQEHEVDKQKEYNRCAQCAKKVGLLGFKCQCESTFCRNHRQPEAHNCSFDFGKVGKERLAKEIFVVKADKVQRF